MQQQSLEFIQEVEPDLIIPDKFKQRRPAITLAELQELDTKFIHNNPEGK